MTGAIQAVGFSKRVKRFVRHGLLQVGLTLTWLVLIGFLLLYVLSTLDPNAMSTAARASVCAIGLVILLLPFMVVSWNVKKFRARYGLLCRSCGRDLAANRHMVKHVAERSVCPYCGAHVD